ncbi:MAG: RcnB family protein [Rhodospirillales bacterium]|nr:RcnB family protein [Rhodospirillales bacterium]MDE2319203.1 RcnB family protein [Rhodospirillales bacterium]
MMRFTRTLLCGSTALAIMAGPALAQPAPDQHQPNNAWTGPGGQQAYHESQHGPMGPGGQQPSHESQRGPGDQQAYHESQHGPMGPGGQQDEHSNYHHGPTGPHGRWARGDHYNGQRYIVRHDDWDRYHLHAPPPGYEWVRSGDQYIMIAITSGIIASIIIGSTSGY